MVQFAASLCELKPAERPKAELPKPLAEYLRKMEPIDRAVRDYVLSGRPTESYPGVFMECMQLVDSSANRIRRRFYCIARDELISAGTLALAESLARIRIMEGVPPTAYIAKRVRGAMFNLLREEKNRSAQVPPEECILATRHDQEELVSMSEIMHFVFRDSVLSTREKEILFRNFFTEQNQRDIAREFGLQQPAVCKIIAKALRKLNEKLDEP
jgi:RNA polymerase sigma factor (sigma-70 family)